MAIIIICIQLKESLVVDSFKVLICNCLGFISMFAWILFKRLLFVGIFLRTIGKFKKVLERIIGEFKSIIDLAKHIEGSH